MDCFGSHVLFQVNNTDMLEASHANGGIAFF